MLKKWLIASAFGLVVGGYLWKKRLYIADKKKPWDEIAPKKRKFRWKKTEDDSLENVCPICLDFLAEKVIRTRACAHVFHMQCLREWMKRRITCPFCRTKLIGK